MATNGQAAHRMTDEEFQALNALVSEGGFSDKSAALRSLIRAGSGFLELKRGEFLGLEALHNELRAQGRNLNQIARRLNKAALMGHVSLQKGEQDELSVLRRAYAELQKTVASAFQEVRQKGRAALHTSDKL